MNGHFSTTLVRWERGSRLWRAALLTSVLMLVAASEPSSAEDRSYPLSDPIPARAGTASTLPAGLDAVPPWPAAFPALQGAALGDLPVPVQALISRAVGRDEPAYRLRQEEGALWVRNPAQGYVAVFRARGLRLRAKAEIVGFALEALGRGDRLIPLKPVRPVGSGNRVEYRRGPLTEWYENGPLGLEQGFTLVARAPGPLESPLTLALALSGTASPALEDERSLRIGSSLVYTGVFAADGDGRELPAWLELRGPRVLLRVDDRSARYPVTIDPVFQRAKLTASDGVGGDSFGLAVAVSADGGTIVVGAPDPDSEGAVYVFERPASGWGDATEAAKLVTSDGSYDNQLGSSVAVSADGSTVVAGAPGDPFMLVGSVYVFERPASGWSDATESAKLTASDGDWGDLLGSSVAVSADGSTVVAGAPLADARDVDDAHGASYVFERPASGWSDATESAKLTASDGRTWDEFGSSVAVSADGGTVVAGAWSADSNQGTAYVFLRPGSGWADTTETAQLIASDGAADDWLGSSVAISGDGGTVIAGAPGWDAGSVDAAQGAAYVFQRPAPGWADATETTQLIASDGGTWDNLGSSVAVSADGATVVAGAPGEAYGGVGSVYVFQRPGSGWRDATETAKLIASDGTRGDHLGSSVAVSADGGTIVAGAPGADIGRDSGQGAAYVFSGGAVGPNPRFTWTVPDRLTDLDGDGLPEYPKPWGPYPVQPSGWRVDFNACRSSGDIARYEWDFGDGSTETTTGCRISHRYAREGLAYRVTLTVVSPTGSRATLTNDVVVQDWLIVSIGDSVASGEGNPDVLGLRKPSWVSEPCHRSRWAGPAQAALRLEQRDPRTSVTFVHLACSGATIHGGILGPQDPKKPAEELRVPQLRQVQNIVGDREIDALLVSVGANDVGFSRIVLKCLREVSCHTGGAAELFDASIVLLPSLYEDLAACITPRDGSDEEKCGSLTKNLWGERLPPLTLPGGQPFPPDRVYLTQYHDPTEGEKGLCTMKAFPLPDGFPWPIVQITKEEFRWARDTVIKELNGAGLAAAQKFGWHYVDGITSFVKDSGNPADDVRGGFVGHGYCAKDHWTVRVGESIGGQGDLTGTLHPNLAGHDFYGLRIFRALRRDLYPGGIPRSGPPSARPQEVGLVRGARG